MKLQEINSAYNSLQTCEYAWEEVANVPLVLVGRFFFATPPGGFGNEMPSYVGGISGRQESVFSEQWLRLEKRFNLGEHKYKVSRFRKEGETRCLFYIEKYNPLPPQQAAQELVQEQVLMVPNLYIDGPQFFSVNPTIFDKVVGQTEAIKITGERLHIVGAWLQRENSNDCIPLYTLSHPQSHRVAAQFVQEYNIDPSSRYFINVAIRNKVYIVDSHPIRFVDDEEVNHSEPKEPGSGRTDNFLFSDLKSKPFYPTNVISAFEFGNTRAVAECIESLVDNYPSEQKKGSLSLKQIARNSGDLATVLLERVWKQVFKGDMEFDILKRMTKYILSTNNFSFDGMLQTMSESETTNSAEHKIREAAINAVNNLKIISKITELPMVTVVTSATAAMHRGETLESYFTDGAPEKLIDPITCVLFVHPVVVSGSEKTLSLCVLESKPGVDPLIGDQKLLFNRDKQDDVDAYILSKIKPIIDGIPNELNFTESLHILSLLVYRNDLSYCDDIFAQFRHSFWEHYKQLFPLFPSVSQIYMQALFFVLSRGEFESELFVNYLADSDSLDSVKKAMISIFPRPIDAYFFLDIRAKLTDGTDRDTAIKLVLQFVKHAQVNFLSTFALQDKQNVWNVIRFAATVLSSVDFDTVIYTLPFDSSVIDIMRSKDVPSFLLVEFTDHFTPLMLSAEKGDTETTQLLAMLGADVNAKDSNQQTPMHLAAHKGHTETVQLLATLGADVNAKDLSQRTPIHQAAYYGHTETVQILATLGADMNAKANDGYAPIHIAAYYGRTETVQLLATLGVDVNARTTIQQQNPILIAASNGHTETVQLLVTLGADMNAKEKKKECTPIHLAALVGHTETVKLLATLGADVNASNISQQTPIFVAAGVGHTEIVKILATFGANVNAKDKSESTPIHPAAYHGHAEIVQLLATFGADVNAKNENEHTPMHFAAGNGHIEIVKLLATLGADVNAKDEDGDSPYVCAQQEGQTEVMKFLSTLGAK